MLWLCTAGLRDVPSGLIKSSFVILRFTSEFSGRIRLCRGEFACSCTRNIAPDANRTEMAPNLERNPGEAALVNHRRT